MGQTKSDGGLSHAAGRRALGRLAARSALSFWRDEAGATAIEYGLIVSLIFLVVVGSMTVFGQHATSVINGAANAINSAV
ncbi:MAG: Flp family type IVb pilin [Caulobacteraceae bacterium]|nr:Flp family type IVb pilin [Caulobacteraceae bacterium]